MTDRSGKRIVEIYPMPAGMTSLTCDLSFNKKGGAGCGAGSACASGGGCGSGGCGGAQTSCGTADPLDSLVGHIIKKHGRRMDVRVADYSTEAGRSEAMHGINAILAAQKERLRVNKRNFDLFMGHAAPIIAIDGRPAFLRKLPSGEEFEKALGGAAE
jgi:hypothetical protein